MKQYKLDALILFMLACVLFVFCLPVLVNLGNISPNEDWLANYAFNYLSRLSLLKYHQLPLWSPYLGGGIPIIGHPYQGFLNPFFVFVLLFGETEGLKIIILLLYVFAAFGMYYLVRFALGYRRIAAVFAALVFTLSSYLPHFLNDGNYSQCFVYLLPWPVAFYLQALKEKKKAKYICLAAAVFALIAFQAGFLFIVSIGIIAAIVLAAIFQSLFKQNEASLRRLTVKVFVGIVFLSLCFSAIKLLPMINFIESRALAVHAPFENDYRAITDKEMIDCPPLNWERFYQSLLVKKSGVVLPTFYIGIIPALFAFLACIFVFSRSFKWLIVFVIFLFLSMGPLAPVDIFKLLWSMHSYVHFIYKQNKYFSIGIIFPLAVLSGIFLAYCLERKIEYKKKKILIFFLALTSLYGIFDMFSNNIYFHQGIFTEPSPQLVKQKDFFPIYITDRPARRPICKNQYFYVLQNVGLINWHSNIILKESAAPKLFTQGANLSDFSSMQPNPFYRGEFYLLSGEGEVKPLLFSPNKIVLEVDSKKTDTVIVNQNFNRGWKVYGAKLLSYQGLIAIEIAKAGKQIIILRYIPFDFWCGLAVTFATVVCAVLWIRKDETQR